MNLGKAIPDVLSYPLDGVGAVFDTGDGVGFEVCV